jgi:hypothetical protein
MENQHKHLSCEILVFYSQNFAKKLHVMDKSGYDFRIQCVEIDKDDIKYFKQWNHCRPVYLILILLSGTGITGKWAVLPMIQPL